MGRHALAIGSLAIGLFAGATAAQAATATWVSGTGVNSGNCPITAPCRTFAFAYDQTGNNGAINVLSSGNFGPLTITKPISIVAQGVEAVINSAAGGAGIIVQAGPGAIVSLRGLTIDLRGTNNDGIVFLSGAALHLHDSVIRRAVNGIRFEPASGTSELHVADTVVANSSGTSDAGIAVRPTGSGSVRMTLNRVHVKDGLGAGLLAAAGLSSGSVNATVRKSVLTGNGPGILTAISSVTVMVDRTALVNNVSGVVAQNSSTVRIGNSTVSGNSNTGLSTFQFAQIQSYGTNQVNGNGTDGAPTSTIAMK